MRTWLLLGITVAAALAGCSDSGGSNADGNGGNGGSDDGAALPANIYDNQTVTAGIDPFNGLPDPADPTVATLGPCSQAVSTCFRYNFTVEAGKPSVTAMLTWPGVSDFDLYLVQEGTQVAMSANDPTTNPVTNEETFTASLRPGDYEVVVAAWIVVQDTFSIAITFE
ncbi:MAG TPA: pre-peptidase C-terminal domain-containing protein [Candidatus Thermoplasmatota archaeon]|nr:pre-peptidase C-terminal domain-containing protein [Candidatus Thermoplasmatota archaeon]